MTKLASSAFPFTPRTLNALTGELVGEGQKAKQFSDAKVSDLKLELTRTGKKTFSFRAQRDGKKYYECIGSYPAIGIDEARKIALAYRAQLDRGLDVSADRKRLKDEPTLAEFFHGPYLIHAKAKKRSWRDDVSRFKRIQPALGHRKLSAVTRRDVELFLLGVLDELTPASHNRFRALLSAVFRCAVEWSVVAANPCSGIRQLTENNARIRALSEGEQMAFIRAADAEANQTAAACLKGLALTGCRKSELQFARWDNVNLERGELFLPATKNGRSRTVLLNDEACLLIANLSSRGRSPWLFLPFTEEEIAAAVDQIALTWLGSLPALNDEDRIVGQVRDWVIRNLGQMIVYGDHADHDEPFIPRETKGIRHKRWILLTETDFAEACAGTSTMVAGKLLKRLGILDCEGGKHKKRHLLGGLNLPATFFYSILTAKLLPQTEQADALAAGPLPNTGLGPRLVQVQPVHDDDDDLEAVPNF